MKRSKESLSSAVRHLFRKRRTRALIVSFAAVVVFITTYLLILPALTLDKEEAEQQGGITVASDPEYKSGELAYDGKSFNVEASFDEKAQIPSAAEIVVEEIKTDSNDYAAYYNKALKAVQEDAGKKKVSDLKFAKFYDIALRSDGKEVEPADTVDVSISYDKGIAAADADHVRVIHFKEDPKSDKVETEILKSDDIDVTIEKDKMTEASFKADSFSVYAVVYTVDFEYEVDGEVHSFSLEGGDSISVNELAKQLGLAQGDDALNEFADHIEKVSFSDETLVKPVKFETDSTVGKVKTKLKLFPTYPLGLSQDEVLALNAKKYEKGEWVLISMKPFDKEEMLTIELDNGQTVQVKVTDAQDAQMVGDEVLTITNPAGTTIDLFDYWIIEQNIAGRDGWGDLNQGWGGHDDADGLNGTGNNKGINSSTSDTEHGHALKFSPAWEGTVFNGTKNDWTSLNSNGRDGLNSYTGSGDPFQGIVEGLLVSGYPKLTTNGTIGSNGESLAYLFDPSVSHDGKASYDNVNNLLYVDKDGYYTYDSRDYKADFHKNDKTFTLTEQTSEDTEIRGFWPFDTQNFWSGMHVNAQFSMPANGQVLSPRGVYKDMQFEFSGDDDTWLYVDGVLVGDGGGIHNRTEIDINFAAGTATVTGEKAGGHSGHFEVTQYLDDLFKSAGKYNDADWEDIGDGSGHKRFKAGTYHTFDMFYLERGGGESNLYIHYNLISTADFTAHKSYEGYDEDDVLQRNQFRFELIGLDGKYRSVWSEEAGDYVLVKEDDTSKAIMPHASSSGAGTTVSPYYNGNTTTELSDGTTVGSQTYITGNVEDGNVNFGTAEISEQDMHDCDEGNPPVYRYMVREVVPDDAVNGDGITWAEATDEQKAAGGFVKDSVIYDNTVWYMSARVTSWTETDASGQEITRYGLSKTYYTDDTYTTKKTDSPFIDIRNRYTPDIANFEFDKINANEEPVEGAVFQLFRDSACKIPAKDSENNSITATSDSAGKVKFTDTRTGIYFMKEVSAPEPYEVNPTVYRVTISKQGSHMSVHSDQSNTPVTQVVNIKTGDITVAKKWLDADGDESNGAGYPATVQLRRYHYVRTGPEPQTHTVTLHFHFPDSGWNEPNKDFGPYEITGNSVVIHWSVNGCGFFWDNEYTEQITDSSEDNLVQLPLDRDIELDIYGNRDWASGNLNTVSVDGAYDSSKELRLDESFPSSADREKATKTLTSENDIYAWSIGSGEAFDFPVENNLGEYLYFIVELDTDGNAVEIGGDVGNGMILKSIEYTPERTEGKGITHGIIIVTNELPKPQTIDVTIRKTGDEESTHYLAGAVFKLYYRADSTSMWNNAKDFVNISEIDSNSKFTVPESGITLSHLVSGQYKLEEIKSPEGYVIVESEPVFFTVENGVITSTEGTSVKVRYTAATETNPAEFIIPNSPGVELPYTGGSGAIWLYMLGALLVLLSGTGLVLKKRRNVA